MIRVGFMGRTKMLADTIENMAMLEGVEIAFILTCQDEPFYQFQWQQFEELADKFNCPFFFSSSVKDVENLPITDVVVSVNFINIIPQVFIDKFPLGVLNAHAGDLPRYQGNACPNWAILNNEKAITLTVHQMNEQLDSGPIICQSNFALTPHSYITEVYKWLEEEIPSLFARSLALLQRGEKPIKQQGKALRTFPRKPEDSQLSFDLSALWNYTLIRASSRPFDGAYCFLNDTDVKVTIYAAEPYKVDYDFCAVSGQIMEKNIEDSSFLVAVQGEVLKVTDYSVNGMSTEMSFKLVCQSMRNRLC